MKSRFRSSCTLFCTREHLFSFGFDPCEVPRPNLQFLQNNFLERSFDFQSSRQQERCGQRHLIEFRVRNHKVEQKETKVFAQLRVGEFQFVQKRSVWLPCRGKIHEEHPGVSQHSSRLEPARSKKFLEQTPRQLSESNPSNQIQIIKSGTAFNHPADLRRRIVNVAGPQRKRSRSNERFR